MDRSGAIAATLWLGALTPPPVGAQATESKERIAALEETLPALLPKHHVAALSVAVIRRGRVVWSAAYGEQGPGVRATPATLFNVASMAKPVSAETILRLVAAGRLTLDEPMAPTWVDPDVAGDPRHLKLTPRLALSHQTGFPNWRRMNAGGRLAFLTDPGTRFGYSGEGYNYVARFAEKRLGAGFEQLADEKVFGPIGLTRMSYSSRPWMAGLVATPMDTVGRWGTPDLHPEGQWKAADDVFTTAAEYARFMISVMKGEGLNPGLAAERMRFHVSIAGEWPCVIEPVDRCPNRAGMALGWFRFDYGDGAVIWHGGDDWGEHSLAYFYPKTQDGYVILVNGGSGRYAVIDAADLLDDRSPIPSYRAAHRSPIGTWLRALLDAEYAGKLR
jgi:CubicO group peptidase (beta-lactamase class C family)